ncbi:MAG: RagB/SusD family nutrient uptake outer membrane protein [Paludibacter sp.]|nr:RagB/SusD family nutrient uptake outer membrane protein [Paludibacter sp.]
MNKLIFKISIVLMALATASCSDFLEQPEGSLITIDSVFNSPDNAMQALFQVYGTCVTDGFPTGANGSGLTDAAVGNGLMMTICDEGDQKNTWAWAYKYKAGTWGPSNQNEFDYGAKVQGMRNACIFIENAERVPAVSTGKYVWNETLKNQTIAEAKYLLASMHYESMIRFGGIPIINSVPRVEIITEDGITKAQVVPLAYRQSLDRTYKYIVQLCDEAIPNLPDNYPSGDFGRVNKGAALALKANTLLWIASPAYNTTTPKVSYGNDNDSLLCLGYVDNTLWQKAAEANKAVLDWAFANDYALLDDPQLGKSDSYNYATGQAMDSRNKEIILINHSQAGFRDGDNFNSQLSPIYWTYAGQTHSIPLNFVRYFRDADGNDLNIPEEGSYSELKALLRKAEPRFHAIAWAPGFQFTKTTSLDANGGRDTAKIMYQSAKGSTFIQSGPGKFAGEARGFYLKKFVNFGGSRANVFWPIYRLAEFYLNYAEALNEINPSDTRILDALNPIRVRGGLPELKPGNATYTQHFGNKDLMREYIKRERAIELFAEEHRPFDLRRWGDAEEHMQGEFVALYLYQNGTGVYQAPSASWNATRRIENDNYLSFYKEVFETRIWEPKMYYYPFPQAEVNKGFIVQNPQW